MAEALVGGAFLSAFLNVVFEKLSSPQLVKLVRGKKLNHKLLHRLETNLCAVQAVLNDAERKQINDPSVKKWIDDLTDAVFVADDLLDLLATEAATNKEEVSKFLPRFLNLNEIEDITNWLEYLVKYKDVLGLKETPTENFSWRIPSTSLVQGSHVYGRVEDKEAIMKLLFDDNCDDDISVIPIVGMGGVGKTTLAQMIYNDENLMKKFDLKAWVCVPEERDIVKLTKTVNEEVTLCACGMKTFNLLQLDIMKTLAGKRFFLVLDDVWFIDPHGWKSFKKPFQCGKGSKILVTTRSQKIASTIQTFPPYLLHELSDEHCWSVLAKHAHFPESGGNSALEKIGKDIVKKCKGLPLAAETFGGLLKTEHDVKNWNTILTRDIWEYSIEDSKIIPLLKLSYYHLPPHQKRCFLYCLLYPKEYRFHKDELILLWMAEDLLRPPKGGETLEEVGSECFNDLASRSFFKQLDEAFVMHDMMHDLAISVAGDFHFRIQELGKASKVKLRTRHLSYGKLSHPIPINFDAIERLKSLRTFLSYSSIPQFSVESEALLILWKLKYLRVLSFCDFYGLEVMPNSIGELILLRYLDLSWTSIKILPESLSSLYNLQTLRLYYCKMLTMLPTGMQNLVNMRHLDIRGTYLKEMPPRMSQLEQLQVLSYFAVGEHEDNGIAELAELSNLHGSLCTSKLENVTNSDEAEEARMKDKAHIEDLVLEWSQSGGTTSTHIEREIFDKLQPHHDLKDLTIKWYRGTRFPDWFLEIKDFNGIENVGDEFYVNKNEDDHSSWVTPFLSLEYLSFSKIPHWRSWSSSESHAFPQLKELRIKDCHSLMEDLPNYLPALETLVIDNCKQLVSCLPRDLRIRKLEIYESNKLVFQDFPVSLKSLSVGGDELVESMFKAITITQFSRLKYLTISNCLSSICFPEDCLPACVKELKIKNCKMLEFPKQQKQQHELLKSLEIDNSCNSLTYFSLESFPNLKILTIKECEILEYLLASQSYVSTLHSLNIHRCPNLESFPKEGLAAPCLTRCYLSKCDKLKSLPCHMNTLVPKLGVLWIWHCPEIDVFPEGGLPPKLTSLEIRNCEKLLTGLSSMGTHKGLIYLCIGGASSESVKSFPKKGLLPQLPSLRTLELCEFETLETLDNGGLLHFTSLQVLKITNCPKLENVVGDKLPPSLTKLQINDSPLFEEGCKMKHPKIWSNILHIPDIKLIQDELPNPQEIAE